MNSAAELTLQKLEELEKEFQKFKDNLANTQSEKLKNTVAFLEKYTSNTAFQYWVLMYLNRQDILSHQQNLAFRIQALEDEINWLKGCGYEVIQERDELINWVKGNAPEFKSQLKWVVAIPDEPDSAPNYYPAECKEIAYRALNRFKNMMTNRFSNSPDIAEEINSSMHVCLWHGTDEEYESLKVEHFYDEAWFKQPMCNCRSADDIPEAFRDKDIVHCFNGDKVLITDSIEEAKSFYGVKQSLKEVS